MKQQVSLEGEVQGQREGDIFSHRALAAHRALYWSGKTCQQICEEGSFREHCDVAHVCSLEAKLIKTRCVGRLAELCAVKKERRKEPKTDSLSRICLNKRCPLVTVLC